MNIPWLAAQRDKLMQARAQGRFPTGLLIHEAPGAGGAALATFAAQAALCPNTPAPCGVCRDCRQVAAGQHPDLRWVTPEEDSKQIKVEQVRELIEQLGLTSHAREASVAVLEPAEALNNSAANALLKTLEEPRAGVCVILITTSPSRLPATLRSRCVWLKVPAPGREQSRAWLMAEYGPGAHGPGDWDAVLDVLGEAPLLAGGVDLKKFRVLRDECWQLMRELESGTPPNIPHLADVWTRGEARNLELTLRLRCIENWITERLLGAPGGAAAQSGGKAQGHPGAGMPTAAHLRSGDYIKNIRRLLRLLDQVAEMRRLEATSYNKTLLLERLLWQWQMGSSTVAA